MIGEENNDQRAGTDRKVIGKTREYGIKEAKDRALSAGTGASGSRCLTERCSLLSPVMPQTDARGVKRKRVHNEA